MSDPLQIDPSSLEISFPEPSIPLLQGAGAPCSWRECMRETAAQTVYYLKHFGHLPPPPPPDQAFRLDDTPVRRGEQAEAKLRRTARSRLERLLDLLPDGVEISASALMRHLGLRHRSNFRARYLNPALQAGLLERTHPGQPHSPHQRYRRGRSQGFEGEHIAV
jgi:hypothetical protein